ncbi:MAG: hypothetical protein L0Y39_12940 [Methylococcaceae bacterium]|nr:hypothetical protein [Methylococcaceae bacterium]
MKYAAKLLRLAIALVSTGLLLPPAAADEDGRYRAIVLQEAGASAGAGSLTPRVFLIDSSEGHMWILERNIPFTGRDKQSFGTVLTYQGKLKPGSQVGEVIYQSENNP